MNKVQLRLVPNVPGPIVHNWSGWPGAWCMNCGIDHPAEGADPEEEIVIPPCHGPKDAHNPYVKK